MTHGFIYFESAYPGGAFFDLAAERCDGVSFFTDRSYNDADWWSPIDDRFWLESFVRNVDFVYGERSLPLARYHPAWSRPFGKMCQYCSHRIAAAIAMPLDCSDLEAEQVFFALDSVSRSVIELILNQKRVRTVLSKLVIAKWAIGFGFTYESPIGIFLTPDQEFASQTFDFFQRNSVAVMESW